MKRLRPLKGNMRRLLGNLRSNCRAQEFSFIQPKGLAASNVSVRE